MARRIAIFGNGELGAAGAFAYDADLVVRFNDCRSAGEAAVRTDIVAVCNTGRPAKAMSEDMNWRGNPAVRAASEIWCARNPQKFSEMRESLAVTYPELDDFCDDYTGLFQNLAAEDGKGFHVISRDVHERLDETFAPLNGKPYVTPSTGILVIEEIISRHVKDGDQLMIAGFSHEGWDGHPWEAERKYLQSIEASGLIERLAPIHIEEAYQEREANAL